MLVKKLNRIFGIFIDIFREWNQIRFEFLIVPFNVFQSICKIFKSKIFIEVWRVFSSKISLK